MLSVNTSDISLALASGSVNVAATININSYSKALNVHNILKPLEADITQATTMLGVPVESVDGVRLTAVTNPPPQRPMLPPAGLSLPALAIGANSSSDLSSIGIDSGLLQLVVILGVLLAIMTAVVLTILLYLRGAGPFAGKASRTRRMPSVRRAKPRMVKVHGVQASRAPAGFGLDPTELAAVNATCKYEDTELSGVLPQFGQRPQDDGDMTWH